MTASPVGRRTLLRLVGGTSAALAASALAAACSGQPGAAPTEPPKPAAGATAPAAKPIGTAGAPAAGTQPAGTAAVPVAPPPGQVKDPPKLNVPPEAADPLKIEPNAQLDGVFFHGGWGVDWLLYTNKIFEQVHPGTKVNGQYIQRLGEQLRPRFIGGNPPDVIYNAGAGNLDNAALVAEGQLLDLAPLLNAPAVDTPGKSFKETLIPGSQDLAIYDGKQYSIDAQYSVYGIWYSAPLFQKKGWTFPKTWEGVLDLCEQIKKDGQMAPWTYQGRYPGYMVSGVLEPLIYKIGGIESILKIDNLEPGAWKTPEVKQAVEATYQLAARGYVMPGTEGLTHTEAQAEWLKGKAALIPCGTWLENEMKTLVPPGFDMVMQPVPPLKESKGKFESVRASPGGSFIVPAKAKSPKAGMEYIRLLLSKETARFFAEAVGSIMTVAAATEGVKLSSAVESALKALDAAKGDTFLTRYGGWYRTLSDEVNNNMGSMLTMHIKPDEFMSIVQKTADEVAKDPGVKKYKREK